MLILNLCGDFLILSKKKTNIYTPILLILEVFLKMQHAFDTSNFSSKYVKQIIGSFYKALHILQFDILNME